MRGSDKNSTALFQSRAFWTLLKNIMLLPNSAEEERERKLARSFSQDGPPRAATLDHRKDAMEFFNLDQKKEVAIFFQVGPALD